MGDSSNGRRGKPPAQDELASDQEESQIFLHAVRQMSPVPDKDRTSPVKPTSRGVRRVKPTKGRGWTAQDRLDLHGKKVEEGLWLLNEFIVGCALRRLRQVIVVTGKGLHSKQGVGVMKQAVERWILGSGQVYVRTFSDAPRQAGGSGAIVLNLRVGRGGDDL